MASVSRFDSMEDWVDAWESGSELGYICLRQIAGHVIVPLQRQDNTTTSSSLDSAYTRSI